VSSIHPECPDSGPSDWLVVPPMSSFAKSPTRKRTKRKTTARKKRMRMTTRPTMVIRSEHGTSYRKTAVEANQNGRASASLDRWESRELSRAYSQCHQLWRAVGWIPRRDKDWGQEVSSQPVPVIHAIIAAVSIDDPISTPSQPPTPHRPRHQRRGRMGL
jgi:hypothetical protein